MAKNKDGHQDQELFPVSHMPTLNQFREALQAIPHGQMGPICKAAGVPQSTVSELRRGANQVPSYVTVYKLVPILQEKGFLR